MKTKHIRIAQGIIAIIFVFAVVYFVLGVVVNRRDAPQKAQKRFDAFMVEASTIAAKYEPNSAGFNGEFTQLVLKFQKEIVYLRLSVNNTKIYDYPAGKIIEEGTARNFSAEAKTVLGNTLTVNAAMYANSQDEMYGYARISFILILTGTLAAVILLIVIQFTAQPRYRRLRHSDDDISFSDETDAFPAENMADERRARVQEEDEDEDIDDDFDPISEMEEENRESMDGIEEEAVLPTEDNPFSGINVQPQIALETELQKAISESSQAENDMALLVLRFQEFDGDSEAAKAIVSVINQKIGTMGTIFNYGNGYAVIVRNTNLDTALATAQALYSVLVRLLQDAHVNEKLTIGISSRCERIISSQRFITEAEQAVLHAAEDPDNPIIAFRVNPEKYREYMQQNN